MIGASMAVITSSPLFGWGVAFVSIAALAFAGRQNQKAGYKRERTNDVSIFSWLGREPMHKCATRASTRTLPPIF